MIVGGIGVALVVGGIGRHMTRSNGKQATESTSMTGWITNDGGIVAAFGRS